jgi:hypothetical protein
MSLDPSIATVLVFVVMWICILAAGLWLTRWYRKAEDEAGEGFHFGL